MNHLYGPAFLSPRPCWRSSRSCQPTTARCCGELRQRPHARDGRRGDRPHGDVDDHRPLRVRRDIPGRPEVCNASPGTASSTRPVEEVERSTAAAPPPCSAASRTSATFVVRVWATIAPIRERRAALLAEPERIDAILEEGAERAGPSPRPSSPRSRRRWGCEAVVTVGDLAVMVATCAGSRWAYDRQGGAGRRALLEAGRAALEAGEWSAAKSAFETAVERPDGELLGLGEAVCGWETWRNPCAIGRAPTQSSAAGTIPLRQRPSRFGSASTTARTSATAPRPGGWGARRVWSTKFELAPLAGWVALIRAGGSADLAEAEQLAERSSARRFTDADLELCAPARWASLVTMGRVAEGIELLDEAMAGSLAARAAARTRWCSRAAR